RKACLAREHRELDRLARLVGLAVDVTDLVDPHAAPEHGRDDAKAAPNLETTAATGPFRKSYSRVAMMQFRESKTAGAYQNSKSKHLASNCPNSLFLKKFSLIRVCKFPVPLRREFGWKPLNSLADWTSKSQ